MANSASPVLHALAFQWLAAALSLALLLHVNHLPLWLVLLFFACLGWRLWIAAKRFSLPRRWLLWLLTLAAGSGVVASYGTLLGRDAGIALLAAMTALKLLEARTLRDGMVLVFLGYFLVMGNLLYTQNLSVAGYLLLVLVVLLATQIMLHQQHTALSRLAPLGLAGRMLLQSLPIMLVLFILFPRIPGPLWGLPKDAHSGLTGLSDTMSPGAISRLGRSDAVAFRVRFKGAVPPPAERYWRGPVLWRYDGRTWSGRPEVPHPRLGYRIEGEPVDYTVILEPHGERWLFALDLPASFPPKAGITHSLQLLRSKPVTKVFRYEMRSYTRYRTGAAQPWEWRAGRWLPPGVHPQARALAAEWQQRYGEPEAIVQAALELFRNEPFYYTLSPPLLGAGGLDAFLFETRQGFCEHYAAGFVFLMRAADIPARVVTGYQGGEFNALGDYFIVRQSDAHAWAEVWLEGRGWVRVDPTAAVAPERIEHGLYAAVEDAAELPLLIRRDSPWLRQLAMGWDTLNNAWNEWVLAYGPERQREFLYGLGFGYLSWRGMTVAMLVVLGIVGLIYGGFYLLRRRAEDDPVARAYQAFCAKLARRGLAREDYEGPLDFAERVAAQRPDLANRARLIGGLYATLRYGRPHGEEAAQRLRRLVRDFKA